MKTILVVDVQNAFIKPKVKSLPSAIRRHIDRTGYDHILFTKFVNTKRSTFVTFLGWDKAFKSPDTDITEELKDLATRVNTFQKSTYSAFKSPRLLAYLKRHKITSMDVCGLEEEGCVLATLFEGFDLGYEMRLLKRLSKSTGALGGAAEGIVKRNIDRQVSRR